MDYEFYFYKKDWIRGGGYEFYFYKKDWIRGMGYEFYFYKKDWIRGMGYEFYFYTTSDGVETYETSTFLISGYIT